MRISISFLIILLIATTFAACSTIPKPIDENVTFPHTFEKVGYLERYGRIGFDHVANLTVETDKVVYSDKDINLVIAFESIEGIAYKKLFFTDINNFVIISYRDRETNKQALFTAFRYGGWVGGTSEVYEVIQLAYNKYKAVTKHNN